MYPDSSIDYGSPEETLNEDEYFHPMFSIPYLHLRVSNWEYKKNKLLDLYEKRYSNKKQFKHEADDVNGENIFSVQTDYHYNQYHNYDYSEKVCDILNEEFQRVSSYFNVSISIDKPWFEKASKMQQHTVHNHGTDGLSGVCFIKYNKKVHTPTKFINPDIASKFDVNFQDDTIDEGSLIIFPSYVYHFTECNTTNEERIIMSFNAPIDAFCDEECE